MEKEDVQALIDDLNNLRTRKAAKEALVRMGEACVAPLVEKLSSPLRDNVKWNIIDILGRIGSERAVPVLKECAKDPTFESVCLEAIKSITGSAESIGGADEGSSAFPPGEDAAPAPERVSQEPEVPEPRVVEKVVEKVVEVEKPPPTPAEVKKLVEEIIAEQDYAEVKPVAKGGEEYGYRFTIKTDKARRRQRVTVCYDTTDEENTPVVCIYSICCEAKPEYYENALRWNRNIASGSVCITDFKGKPHFVLLRHLSFKDADKDTIRAVIESLGNKADKIEKILTGAEDFR